MFVESLTLPFGESWIVCQPGSERLAVLNATGKTVWDLLCGGLEEREIAAAFAQRFRLPVEAAAATIRSVIGGLEDAGFLDCSPETADKTDYTSNQSIISSAIHIVPNAHCGTFQFGGRRVQIHSALASIGRDYVERFRHRAIGAAADAAILAISAGPNKYRLAFQGEFVADADCLAALIGRAHELILSWEHPDCELLAYFHAAAVSRGERSLLLPGVSGAGKSTLTAYLAAHDYAYLGDDLIALARSDWSLRPLPTCLSVKSGSWPILAGLYPDLFRLPVVQCHGREARYLEPRQRWHFGPAPSAILFPHYVKNSKTSLNAVTPLEAVTRLIETSTDLHRPVTGPRVAEFLKFVEQTPAYELIYDDLPSAQSLIEKRFCI